MKKFWNLKKTTQNSAELMLYGAISEDSWFGDEVTPKQFSEDLKSIGNVSELSVRINSGGGDVFAGVAIHTMLKNHPANITVYVDGLAASIASVIAMAGDKVIMPQGSMMMIHNPWTIAMGDSTEFRAMADVLDKIREAIVDVYLSKTTLSKEEVIELMNNETWMTGSDAVEKGFADAIDGAKIAASIKGDVAVINGVEVDWKKFLHPPELPEEAPKNETPKNEEPEFDEGRLSLMRKRLILLSKL